MKVIDGSSRGPVRDYNSIWNKFLNEQRSFGSDEELAKALSDEGGGTENEAMVWLCIHTIKGKDVGELTREFKKRKTKQ